MRLVALWQHSQRGSVVGSYDGLHPWERSRGWRRQYTLSRAAGAVLRRLTAIS